MRIKVRIQSSRNFQRLTSIAFLKQKKKEAGLVDEIVMLIKSNKSRLKLILSCIESISSLALNGIFYVLFLILRIKVRIQSSRNFQRLTSIAFLKQKKKEAGLVDEIVMLIKSNKSRLKLILSCIESISSLALNGIFYVLFLTRLS